VALGRVRHVTLSALRATPYTLLTSVPSVKRLIVAVTGGSGMLYALDLLQTLRPLRVETQLVVTSGAKQVIPTELDLTVKDLEALADVVYKDSDLGAAISSGSYPVHGMVVVPCSAGTLAKVALGMADNLVSRAAMVTLKERRPLVLVVREAPFSRPMLKNMLEAFDAGATILPASPGFYHRPESVEELIGTVTARALDLLGIENARARRWKA
jgi:4-hydroxy-3-polyprenylbenzoate decarboxylase